MPAVPGAYARDGDGRTRRVREVGSAHGFERLERGLVDMNCRRAAHLG